MKDTYEVHSVLARMFATSGFNVPQIESAVKAIKGAAKLIEKDEKSGSIKLKEATKSDKAHTGFTLAVREKYRADDSAPMRFGSWTDSMAEVWKKHGEPHGELTIEIVPAHLFVWISGVPSFRLKPVADAAKPEDKAPEADATKAPAQANRRNGGVTVGSK